MLALLCVLDLVVLVRSGSRTSVAAMTVAVTACAFWLIARSLAQSQQIQSRTMIRFVYPLFVGSALLIAWIGFRFQQLIVSWFGKAEFFNGRSALWHFSWTGFRSSANRLGMARCLVDSRVLEARSLVDNCRSYVVTQLLPRGSPGWWNYRRRFVLLVRDLVEPKSH